MSDQQQRDIFWETVGDDAPVPRKPVIAPGSVVTDRLLLLALGLLILVTFGFVAYDALKDRGTVCHIRTSPGPPVWRTLYCPPGSTFDSVAIDEPWQPKGYP